MSGTDGSNGPKDGTLERHVREERPKRPDGKVESGADDIMKVTGHASPKMLKKYIKADSLEVVEKLTDKYEYFR